MIRVVYLINELEIGGAETQLFHFLRHLDRERFDPTVIYLFGSGELVGEVRDLDIPVHNVGLTRRNLLPAATRLLGLLRKIRPHILHLHLIHATVLGIFLSRTFGIGRCVVTRHFHRAFRRGFVRRLEGRLLPYAARIIAVSDFVRGDVEALPGVRRDKVVTVYNGLDMEWFDASAARVNGAGKTGAVEDPEATWPRRAEGEVRIGALANWREWKGLGRVLAAYSALRDEAPGVQLWVGGSVPDASRQPDIEGVTWWGPIPHGSAPSFMRQLDIFLHPSAGEAFGLTVLEAMAAGRPVVGLAAGGLREVVVHGETGFLVEETGGGGMKSSLSACLMNLIRDPELRGRMGTSGRERVVGTFSIREIVRRVEALYVEVCPA